MNLNNSKQKKEKHKLKLDWATHKAAKFACENWHYSKCMPAGKTVKIGVWEDGRFIGAVIYALGANANIAKLFGKTCELARIALSEHKTEVTRIVAISMKLLIKKCPELEAIVSYADLDRHEGTIYKAGNWEYLGKTNESFTVIHGKKIHGRSVFSKYGTRSIKWLKENVDSKAYKIQTKGKKRFVYFLRGPSKDSVANGDQPLEGGASPTGSLQKLKKTRQKREPVS